MQGVAHVHALNEMQGMLQMSQRAFRRSSALTRLSMHGSPQALQDGKEDSLVEGASQVGSMILAALFSFPIALLQLHGFILHE